MKSRRHTPMITLSVDDASLEKKEGAGFYEGRISLIRSTEMKLQKMFLNITKGVEFTNRVPVSIV